MGRVKSARQRFRSERVGWHGEASATGSPSVSWLIPLVVVLATGLAFLPTFQNGFVDWDDYENFISNPNYRGLGWTELRWMFTTFRLGHYQPLSWITLALDYIIWGTDPFGFHLTNLILHSINALLFYFVAVRLLSLWNPALPAPAVKIAAGFSALFFAIHPLRVESVAWASERRDVQSGLFFFLTLLCYLKAAAEEKKNSSRWLGLALVAYSLSLLSKAVGMTLPVVLLLLDFYPLKRLSGGPGSWFGPESRRVWLEKIPFFILGVAAGAIALAAQRDFGALKTFEQWSAASRVSQALFGLVFYLWKTLIPFKLSPLYPLPQDFNPWDSTVLLSAAIVVALSAALLAARDVWPAALASWIFYILLLAPVLGFAQSGAQFVADRYSYLACSGWAVLAGAVLLRWRRAWTKATIERRLIIGTAAMILVVLAILTWKQTQVWHDSEKLWRHVLSVVPESELAHANLAAVLLERNEFEEALAHDREAVRLRPASADAHFNLGVVLAAIGSADEAMEHYREALRLNPRRAETHFNMAAVLFSAGKLDEAMAHYREALRINPDYVEAHYNLGGALLATGRIDEAIEHYRAALRIDPDFALAHNNLGSILLQRGRLDDAIKHFQETLRINPGSVEAQHNLEVALAKRGR
jgi:protein O-mannosyl-transferase